MQEQQKGMQAKTIEQKSVVLAAMAIYPALTIMVFTRKKMGFRFISDTQLMIMSALLYVLAAFSVRDAKTSVALFVFTTTFLVYGMIQRRLRYSDIKHGIEWHSYSRGIPWLSYILRLNNNRMERFVEPCVVAAIGFVIGIFIPLFGAYVMFAALCMAIFSTVDFNRDLNRMLDQIDGMIASRVDADNLLYYTQPNVSQRRIEETAGIPTGVASDIAVQVEILRQKAYKRHPQFVPVNNQMQTIQKVIEPPVTDPKLPNTLSEHPPTFV